MEGGGGGDEIPGVLGVVGDGKVGVLGIVGDGNVGSLGSVGDGNVGRPLVESGGGDELLEGSLFSPGKEPPPEPEALPPEPLVPEPGSNNIRIILYLRTTMRLKPASKPRSQA